MKSITIMQVMVIGAGALLAGLTGAVVAGDVQGGMRDVTQAQGRSSAMVTGNGSVKAHTLTVEAIGRAPKGTGETAKQSARSSEGLIVFGRGTPNLAIIQKGDSSKTLAGNVQ